MFARADISSIQLLLHAFNSFSQASGLEANIHKSNIYIGGISDDLVADIHEITHIPYGEFPFKYLGIPLSTKKRSYISCKPLVDKIMARTKTWAAKNLSYAGRVQLIRTILLSMQVFWCQIFLLPKKIVKEIQSYCRTFLWPCRDTPSKKTLVA